MAFFPDSQYYGLYDFYSRSLSIQAPLFELTPNRFYMVRQKLITRTGDQMQETYASSGLTHVMKYFE
jgi:hypothetical protein